ncbi:MAG: hypothetical protein ACLGIT_11575 [Gammaproteobacteria bacterium]
MNARQIEACADRLPQPERDEFLRLMAEAKMHFLRSVAARRVGWELYRQATGLPRRPRGSK